MFLRYTLLWLFLPVIGILNGTIRELFFKKYLAELPAHQLSTFSRIILFGCFIGFVTQKWPFTSGTKALKVGFIWLILTIWFEFGFGHYVVGDPWQKLLHDYNLLEGRVWTLVLLWITIAPWLFYKIHLRKNYHSQTIN